MSKFKEGDKVVFITNGLKDKKDELVLGLLEKQEKNGGYFTVRLSLSDGMCWLTCCDVDVHENHLISYDKVKVIDYVLDTINSKGE